MATKNNVKMKKVIKNNKIQLAVRIILIAVFLTAGVGKLMNISEFAKAVFAFKLLPLILVNYTAIMIPIAEITAALLLISRITCKFGSMLIILLNAIFIIAAITVTARGMVVKCSCFPGIFPSSKVGLELIFRDLALIVLSMILFSANNKSANKSFAENSKPEVCL